MSHSDEDQLTLFDRLRYSAPRKPSPDANPTPCFCTYCYRVVHLLPHEFRLCQTRTCLEQAIVDRENGIFELQLSIPRVQAQLLAEKAALLAKIAELEVQGAIVKCCVRGNSSGGGLIASGSVFERDSLDDIGQ